MTLPIIGWIGLGKMGAPMCERLLVAGFPVHVFDLNEKAVQACADKGGQPRRSVAELAQGADIVVTMVPDDSVLLMVGAEVVAHLGQDRIFADMSTVSPEASQQIADLATQRGVHFVCAPVSGSTELAQQGLLTVFASGLEPACAALDGVFSTFAANRYRVGDSHQARYIKLAINHMVGATAALMAEALALGRKGNIDWDIMLQVMGASVIASPLVKYKLQALKNRDFTPAFSAAQMRKDMGLVVAAGQHTGSHMPIAEVVLEYYQGYAQLNPDRDFFGLVEEVEAKSHLSRI